MMKSVFALRELTEDYDSCYNHSVETTIGLAGTVAEIVDFLAKQRARNEVFRDEDDNYPDNPLILSRGYVIEEVLLNSFTCDAVLRSFNWRGEEIADPEDVVVG